MTVKGELAVTPETSELGILFVHGLGEAKRGETLTWAGDPLFNSLRSWYGRDSLIATPNPEDMVRFNDVYLSRVNPDDDGAPAYADLVFKSEHSRADGSPAKWVFAESWWAGDFPQASFSSLWKWALGILPWVLARTARNIIHQIDFTIARSIDLATIDIRQPGGWFSVIKGIFWALPIIFMLLSRVVVRLLLHPLIFVAGLLARLVIFALVLLAFIPPISSLIKSIQQGLASNFGDGYMIASSPESLIAMTTQNLYIRSYDSGYTYQQSIGSQLLGKLFSPALNREQDYRENEGCHR